MGRPSPDPRYRRDGCDHLRSRQLLTDPDLQEVARHDVLARRYTTCFGRIEPEPADLERHRPQLHLRPRRYPTAEQRDDQLSDAELTNFDTPGNDFGPANPSCAATDDTSPYFMWTADCRIRIRATIGSGPMCRRRHESFEPSSTARSAATARAARRWTCATAGGSRRGSPSKPDRDGTACTSAGVPGRVTHSRTTSGRGSSRWLSRQTRTRSCPTRSSPGPIVYASVQQGTRREGSAERLRLGGDEPAASNLRREREANRTPGRGRQGSLNQALDCDAAPIQLYEEIRDGCDTPYQTNTRNLECGPNPTWDTNNLPPPLPPFRILTPTPTASKPTPVTLHRSRRASIKWEDPGPRPRSRARRTSGSSTGWTARFRSRMTQGTSSW